MFSARRFLYFRRPARQFTMKTSAQKTDIFTCRVGSTDASFARNVLSLFRTNDSRRQYDKRPVAVGRSRRTADASRLSADFRAKKPFVEPRPPTQQVFQTDIQSMPSALSVVRGKECKIIVNEKNAVQFCGA